MFFISINYVNQLPKRLYQYTTLEEVKVLPTKRQIFMRKTENGFLTE